MTEFKNPFGQNIFDQKYATFEGQTWAQKADDIVTDVTHSVLEAADKNELRQAITDFKFLPGGRYIYYAGRQARFYNNCGVGETKLLTDKGWVRFDEVVGQNINVYSPVSGGFESAIMNEHGTQSVYKYTLKPLYCRNPVEVVFTEDHKWPTKNRGVVEDLCKGDVLSYAEINLKHNDEGYLHGAVFADGNKTKLKSHWGHQLRLCGGKSTRLGSLVGYDTLTYPPFAEGDPVLYITSSFNMKDLPETLDAEYLASFIKGWLDFDGNTTRGGCIHIHTIDEAAIDWLRDNAVLAGYGYISHTHVTTSDSNYGKRKPLYDMRLYPATDKDLVVVAKEHVGEYPVYCPFEPKHNRIVIDHGIDTFQCYLLKGEEDTREEWGNLTKRSSDCLMSGGGIGIDYSVFRPKGSELGRTGGVASGPVPLMNSINEIGRNVMQGGSRRSAIYASLNWKHGDIEEFLTMKDWGNIYHTPGGMTYKEIKDADFNAAAPLDMTNISINYDNEFLEELYGMDYDVLLSLYEEGGIGVIVELPIVKLPDVFVKNVEMAMRNGEPGFSFNFFDKVEETLRNACTEVTSEDDSDVCNLGSINMGAVKTLEEFKRLVAIGTKFLVCGTLEADLPYPKVADVRVKNRRLGLGIMGVHEWLLQRGYKYEMNDELREWMQVYKDESKRVADLLCDLLGISRPVAYRAIAPTGTIGILAGTTTGIEPVYAVAYKRRYLTDGTDWKFEYVIDNTAKVLIDENGIDPDSIETAAAMALDPERRIKFQADIQDYVDMAISSTLNLPEWGSEVNNINKVEYMAKIMAKYAPRLRGLTFYPDGSRGGQPLTLCPYEEALGQEGIVYEDNDNCKGGICGL